MKVLLAVLTLVVIAGCTNPEPRTIKYDSEQCAACKMTISDRHFAAQAVLNTGKQYVFDAPECMLGWYRSGADGAKDNVHSLYVTDYAHPETFIHAEQAFYAEGDAWESPMVLNVAAFSTAEERDNNVQGHGGTALTYPEVQKLTEEYR